jgi:hypothetical protein
MCVSDAEALAEMSAAKQLALGAGIPVLKKPDGTEYVKVSQATALYLAGPRRIIEAPLSCSCVQRPYPHSLDVHRKLFEAPGTYEVRIRWTEFESGPRWPWSLRFAPEMEA